MYLVLSDPWRAGVGVLGMRVMLTISSRMAGWGPMGVTILASKLETILHHVLVMSDVVLDIDITKVRANVVRKVPMRHLMMMTRMMTRGHWGHSCCL